MKKIYISICALAISFSVFAQVASQTIDYSKNFNQVEYINEASKSNSLTPITNIVWGSDFSNPSDWVLDNDGQNPPDYGWSIDPNADGWWSSNGINSTSGGNFAEVSNGPTSSPAGGVIYTMTTAQPINIFDSIGSGNATLSFEEYGARFYDLQEIQISTDGTTFTTVGDNLSYSQLTSTGGSAYANPTLREINIAPYIGSTPTTVWIRFSWTSALALTVNDPNYYNTWIAYGWYIDDVKIAESPANRITMEDEVIGGFWIDYANYSGSGLNDIYGLDYSITPLSQIQNHPYAIESILKNEGTSSQEVTLNYDVTGTAISSGSSSVATLAPGDSVIQSAAFSPTAIGNYSIDIYGTADSVGAGVTTTLSNTENINIEVTDYIYGKDLGELTSGSWILGGPGDQWHFTTRYEMYADEQLYSLRAYITNESVIGAEVKAIIYEVDSTATNDIIILAESDNYTITSSDLGSWVDIPFVSPINLFSGYAYEFGIAGFQHPVDSVFVGTSGESMYNGEHSLFDEMGLNPNSNGTAGTPTWYYLTSTPMVRMNFDPASVISAVSDVKQTIFNVYPNPSNGVFTIELDATEKHDITVNNALGQTVISITTNGMNTTIDLSKFDKGVYTVELKNNSSTYVEKVIVE
tara:strand:- start:14 stop:1927 length:1914 start_codon:yes stop_codon:yes gene_type:complete